MYLDLDARMIGISAYLKLQMNACALVQPVWREREQAPGLGLITLPQNPKSQNFILIEHIESGVRQIVET